MADTAQQRIGLIAGNGKFPFLVLEGARARGVDIAVAAIKEHLAFYPDRIDAMEESD